MSLLDFAGLGSDTIETNHEAFATREEWLNAFVKAATPAFCAIGLDMPEAIRVSIGWPSSGIRSKTIGECWVREASGDQHAEIFISPALKEPARIAGVLTHELIHAIVGHEAKHGVKFAKPAKALGLEGKMTATTEGPVWEAWALPVLEALGPYPGSDLSPVLAGGKKKQKARMLKLECDTCGIVARTTRKSLQAIADVFAEHDEEGEEELPFARCINPMCKGHMPFDLNASEDEGEGE